MKPKAIISHYLDKFKIRLRKITLFTDGERIFCDLDNAGMVLGMATLSHVKNKLSRLHIDPVIPDVETVLYPFDPIALESKLLPLCEARTLEATKEIDDFGDEDDAPLESVSLDEAKRRHEIEKVKQQRLKNAQLLGELIPAAEVDRELASQAALHLSLLRNEQAIFPNLLENKSREEIEVLVREYHYEQIKSIQKLLEKRKNTDLNDPVLSDVIYGMIEGVSSGDMTWRGICEQLGIEVTGKTTVDEVVKKRYSHSKTVKLSYEFAQ